MSRHTREARAKADAEFEKVQSEARAREKARDARDTESDAQEAKTARLKALRLARDADGSKT